MNSRTLLPGIFSIGLTTLMRFGGKKVFYARNSRVVRAGDGLLAAKYNRNAYHEIDGKVKEMPKRFKLIFKIFKNINFH